MMDKIDSSFELLAKDSPATNEQVSTLTTYFGSVPKEYVDLVFEATEIELQHRTVNMFASADPSRASKWMKGMEYGIEFRARLQLVMTAVVA